MTAGRLLMQIKVNRRSLCVGQRKKTLLLNEAISNTAMGTSADEQMLCCHVFLSLISHSAVSHLQWIYRCGPCRMQYKYNHHYWCSENTWLLCAKAILLGIDGRDDFCSSLHCKWRPQGWCNINKVWHIYRSLHAICKSHGQRLVCFSFSFW